MLAVADAAGYGARWVISDTNAWEETVSTVRFFETHKNWRDFRPLARLGVLSDFTGDNEFLSSEMLNLTSRRHQPFRVLDKTKPIDLTGLVAVIYTDQQAPAAEVNAKLLAFAQAGGLLIAPPGTIATPAEETRSAHSIRRFGKGRIAMPVEKWSDPFVLADQVHVLLSHREDVVQLWNAADMDTFYLASPKEDRAVTHLIPYASGRTPEIVLGFKKSYRSAHLLTLDEERAVRPVKGQMGIEIPIDGFTDYAALVLEA